ncbi:MAG: tetratricopeptide repeat protein [Lewinellaceae bacterium]|nr:tetratricopeptide repeat protein [Saprospiraceae bacterium]MCB9337720.1 tetratricopeptide repeat protein [Lewinellaceae bacterium]
MKKFYTSIVFIAVFLILSGCVTQKKKEDVGPIAKGYHNMTARYNGYYNATVLLEESKLGLEQQYEDDFSKILPIYKFMAAENPKAEAEKLDKAIEKVSLVVNLHRVSRWTDDCYLLFGKAQFMKQDYEAAQEAFEFLTGEYDPVEVAKREAKLKRNKAAKKGKSVGKDGKIKMSKKQREKLAKQKRKEKEKERKRKNKEAKKSRKGKGKKNKPAKGQKIDPKKGNEKITQEEEKDAAEEVDPNALPAPGSITLGNMETKVTESDPESYFLKHRPAYQEGVLWLAKTYIERENYPNAERLLSQLEASPSTFDDVRRDAALAMAHFYLKQKKYDQAAEPLQRAIALNKDRKMEARLNYILGQVHQRAKRGPAAYEAYEAVLKNQPSFEMEFNARLNLALAGVNSAESSEKELQRMLKEEKNKEYQDQIYFALAQIALQKGDRAATIENLELSLASSGKNKSQKVESAIQLADLYFEDQDFVKAKEYYDVAMSSMDKTDERYDRVSNLANNLQDIAKNIQIVALQDSLLRISRMTNDERREMAFKIKQEQDEKRLDAARNNAGPAPGGRAPAVPTGVNPPAGGAGASKFWAYDDREVKKGIREFQRKWGSRALVDNWRRSSQEAISVGEEGVATVEAKSADKLTEEEIDAILKDVPESPEDVAAANRQIEGALFALGTLYRDRLDNNDKAVESLQKLLERYPESQYALDAYYYLYLAYKDLGDAANAQVYYDKIVNGFPNTNYARILSDPDYSQKMAAKENKLTTYYNETYAAFENRQYETAHERISKVGDMFGGGNSLQARFALLNAMCIGNLEGKDEYINALKEVIAKYPDEPEAARAREILRLLGEKVGSGPGQERDLPAQAGQVGNFKVDNDQLHYVIIVFKNEISLNDAKVAVSNYNTKFHNLQKLRMNNIYLGTDDNKLPLIAIRRYKDKAEAMDYYDGIQKNRNEFLDESKYQFEVFAIGQDNYRELLKSKNIDEYRTFFEANYFK